MNARYQTGALGRFISQDQVFWAVGDGGKLKDKTGLTLSQYLENPQGFNSYSYAFNNPLKYQDNRGEFAFLAPLAYYAVATAPTWVPAAITWTAAATLAITAPLVGGAAASYYQGDIRSGDAMINGAMITNGICAAGVGGVMAAGQFNNVPQVANRSTNFRELPVVPSAQQKLDVLSQKFGLSTNEILGQSSKNIQKFIDNANNRNINTWVARPDGGDGFIRVTTNPEMTRIISAGINTVENVKNGIASGRFTPLR